MQNLPAWYQNAEQQILGQASTIAGASQPIYQGPQLADFSDPQNQAFAGVNSLQGSTNAPLQGAIGSSGQIAQGYDASQAQQYQNPYTQNVVQDINTLGQQTLNQQLLPGTAGDFIKAGAFGGQQYGNTQAEVIQKQDQNIAQQQNAALQSSQAASQANYLQGQQNQNTANTNVGNLTNQYDTQNLNNLNAQLNVGNQQQQQQQNAYGVAQNNFYNQANYPLEQLGIAQAALRGTTIPTEGQIYTPSNSSTSSASSLQALLQGLQGTGTSAATGGMIPYMAAGGQVKGYATGNAVSNEQPTTEMGSASAAFSPNEYYRARLMLNQLKQLGQPTISNQQPSAEDPGAVVKNLIQNPIYAPTGGVAPIQQPLAQHVPQAQMLAQQSAGANNPTANPGLINPQLSTQQMLQQLAQSIGQSNLKGQAFRKGGMLKGYADGNAVTANTLLDNQAALKALVQAAGPSVAQNQVAAAQTAQEAPSPAEQQTSAPAMMGMTPEMMQQRQRMAMQNIQQLQQLAQGAPQAQQVAEGARQQYADTDQSTAQAQLAATLQAKPWLVQPYQGGANPELAIQAADAIKDQNPGLATSLKLLGGPSVDELNQRNAYQEQLRALTMGPAQAQMAVSDANYADKSKALQEAAQTSTSGLGTSALFKDPLVTDQMIASMYPDGSPEKNAAQAAINKKVGRQIYPIGNPNSTQPYSASFGFPDPSTSMDENAIKDAEKAHYAQQQEFAKNMPAVDRALSDAQALDKVIPNVDSGKGSANTIIPVEQYFNTTGGKNANTLDTQSKALVTDLQGAQSVAGQRATNLGLQNLIGSKPGLSVDPQTNQSNNDLIQGKLWDYKLSHQLYDQYAKSSPLKISDSNTQMLDDALKTQYPITSTINNPDGTVKTVFNKANVAKIQQAIPDAVANPQKYLNPQASGTSPPQPQAAPVQQPQLSPDMIKAELAARAAARAQQGAQ